MTRMRLAMYKGPADGLVRQGAHLAVCARTWSRYSHVELAFGTLDATGHALCWSSSARDGGVRPKRIQLTSGRWDLVALPWRDELDEAVALQWFKDHEGMPYDWAGNAGFVLPWRTEARDKAFCSEAVGAALGHARPWTLHPAGLMRAELRRALVMEPVALA